MRILALDTSLSKSGWAVITVTNGRPSVTDYGLIKSDAKLSDGERLRQIHSGILSVLERYPDVDKVIPIEDGIVRFNTATKQIAKARGVIEFSLADYTLVGVNIASIKAWARRVTGSPGKRNDKAMIAEAVALYYADATIEFNKGGDIADAVAVGTVYLINEGVIA